MASLLVAVNIAASGYLVNYAIRRAGNGGDRHVEEIVIEAEGAKASIEAERAVQAHETAEFLNAVPGLFIKISADDGIHLPAIAYERDASAYAFAAAASQAFCFHTNCLHANQSTGVSRRD